MFVGPRLSNKQLAEFCHRLEVEADAGIDIRRTWKREADSARGSVKPYLREISSAIGRGTSLTEALARARPLFPSLFLEMVQVGEDSGTLVQVYRRLSDYYGRQNQMQRAFLAGITWPLLELALAVGVIGALIWVLGIVAERNQGDPIDPLGWGLIGNRGLAIYSFIVLLIVAGIATIIFAIRRGKLWTRPIQHALPRLPAIGPCFEKLALARMAWVFHLTLNVAMDMRRIVPRALRATGSDYYIRHSDMVVSAVEAGLPLHVALSRAGIFPGDFIDAVAVGEESGRIVESMERLSLRYEEEAASALKTLTVITGFGVAVLVMALITFMIFRLAGFYFGTVNDLLN